MASGVYEMTVPINLLDPWTVNYRPFTGVTSVPAAYVAGKRWSYCPSLGAIVWQPSARSHTYVYRPAGV